MTKAFENLFPRNKNCAVGIPQNLKKKKNPQNWEIYPKKSMDYNTLNLQKYLYLASP